MTEKRFYTPAEVAAILDVSSATVLRLIHDRRLPAVHVSERVYRIPIPAFERFQAGEITDPWLAEPAPIRRVDEIPEIGAGEPLPRAAAAEPERVRG
jgi:excisionase family DNA binding protein